MLGTCIALFVFYHYRAYSIEEEREYHEELQKIKITDIE